MVVVEVAGNVLSAAAKLMLVNVACLTAIDHCCTLDTRGMVDEEVVKVMEGQEVVGGPFLKDRIVYQPD